MAEEKKSTNYPRKIARILLKTILFLVLFVLFIFILILTPPVQRFLTGKAESYLQNKLKTRVEIGRISFGLSGKVNLLDVYIEDQTKDTLIAGGALKTHINFLKLFSNEIEIKDLELQNITAKIKRVLPDTVFNYQFIVDAFTAENKKNPDTAQTAPMKLSISDISLENIRLTYTDAITGNDLFARIGNFSATIDTLDPYTSRFSVPTIIGRNVQVRMKQTKPLVEPEPLGKDLADAKAPAPLYLSLGTIDLSRFSVQYSNDVSAFYTTLNLGTMKATSRVVDINNNRIHLDNVELANTSTVVRLGRKPAARVVKKEVAQEVAAQATKGFDFRIGTLRIDNNTIQYDDENAPRKARGMDFSHLAAEKLTLHVDDLVFDANTIGASVKKGTMQERSGFVLEALQGNLLYANNQAYLKDLYIKTPGTLLRRNLVLDYASKEALVKNADQTVINIELTNSRVQVKDILAFAPQLSSNPAFSNPEDIWDLNLVGSGTMNRLNIEALQFSGFRDTRLDAYGTLEGLADPARAGGNFTIRRLHTTQSDLALFIGPSLAKSGLNLPQAIDMNGTINGNAGSLNTRLNLTSTAGSLSLNGRFSQLTSPSSMTYAATVNARGLQVGSILRQPAQYGSLTGTFTVDGRGVTPETINTRFRANINSVGYNRYQYRNINLAGTLAGTRFTANIDANDPNASLDLQASGNFSGSPTFRVQGMIDSLKAEPLNFSTQTLIFRGHIDGTVAHFSPEYLDANLLITRALLVTADNRLPLDTLQLIAGRTDTANFIRLQSPVANASLTGQYRIADLGGIIQSTIQPYFAVTPPAKAPNLQPYDFRFTADLVYHPVLTSFVPGLTEMDPVHAEGRFATGQGMQARLTTDHINFNGNDLADVNITANTADSGLQVLANIGHIQSGNSFDVYNTRLTATALNNEIDFRLGIDDANSRNKYLLHGLLRQPQPGVMALSLRPDSLLLNYQIWNIPADNAIVVGKTNITANNFVLQREGQQLSINSLTEAGEPLEVAFRDFRLATITGFIKADSLLADGVLNGNIRLRDIMEQPAFTSDLTITDLSMRQDTLGNLALRVNTGSGNRYNTDLTLTGRGNDLALTGYFVPGKAGMALNLDLDVRQLQLNTLEGALATAIANPSGAINGGVRIRGTTANPSIRGDLNFNNASFALTMLGSQFTINNEKLSVTENGFVFDTFTIRDSANNALTIDGTVLTTNLVNYNFNLNVRARDFLAMNSTKEQNKIYYGRLNISTNMRISGTESKPVVDGSLAVNDGTNLALVVPQAEPGVREREGIVEFVDMDSPENDSLFRAYDSLNRSGILGMDIAANIEIKKEAILNVVIDQANGDFLNVQGEALLSAGIDPSGKITMVGNYTLEQGSYEISFNFLRRRFDIERGSTITWTGEPTTAQLNVTAVYVANTPPIDLVQDQIAGSQPAIRNTYRQNLPFEVHLNLTGELLKPVVAFDILLPESRNYGVSNDIVTLVQGRLSQLRQDPGEVNKQVFSLLLLGRFVGENPFESSGGGFSAGTYARQSVSRLLTEQLNQLGANLIQGVDLNFDLQSTEDYTTGERRNRTDLNVGLSKQLLNDRLKITVGSNFQLEGPQQTNQRATNLAGNVAADYQLTKDGRYLIRFFRRNQYEGVVDGYIIENGISFILSVDYNRFREILRGKRQRISRDSTNQNQ
jgi:translocation and assembly module TamB